jgi:hypothetical protein
LSKFFDPEAFTKAKNDRESVHELIRDLFNSGLFPRTVSRYGFTVDVEGEVPKFVDQATDDQIKAGVGVIEKWIYGRQLAKNERHV